MVKILGCQTSVQMLFKDFLFRANQRFGQFPREHENLTLFITEVEVRLGRFSSMPVGPQPVEIRMRI